MMITASLTGRGFGEYQRFYFEKRIVFSVSHFVLSVCVFRVTPGMSLALRFDPSGQFIGSET